MMMSWWFVWMMFLLIFLVAPTSYGWAYRGWGPPYPRSLQRWRGERAALGSSSFNHLSWGRGGDFVWMMMIIGIIWAATAYWWLR